VKRLALIDGDLLVHEIAVLGQYYDEADVDKERLLFRHFNYLETILVSRIEEICEAAGCDGSPVIYLSGKNNFRYDIATVKPYKGNRKDLEKPVHWDNVKWFLISRYNAIIVDGMEADDALAIHQYKAYYDNDMSFNTTVICTRDKDLRQVMGWHYGWEVGAQPEQPLKWVSSLGQLTAIYKEGESEKTGLPTKSFKKLTGDGYLYFASQVLTGDATDNIPGLTGCGPKKAYECLKDCKTEQDALKVIIKQYQEVYGFDVHDTWKTMLIEQARLVWMVRELNEDGNPKMWEIEDE
jgi:hypothetical protein